MLRGIFESLLKQSRSSGPMAAMAIVGAATLGLLTAVVLWGGLTFGGGQKKGDAPEAAEPLRLCRVCTSLAGFRDNLESALAKEPTFKGEDGRAIRDEIVLGADGWRRRCSLLLCSKQAETGACRSPPGSLLAELALIEEAAATFDEKTKICSLGGCLSGNCEHTTSARTAIHRLKMSVTQLADEPKLMLGEVRTLATPFLFDRLSEINQTVRALPSLVVANQYAAAEIRLLLLRDEAQASAAEASSSVEIFVADRLSELSQAVDSIAAAKRRGADRDELAELWSVLAQTGARLLIETATLQTEQSRSTNPILAIAKKRFPTSVATAGLEICDGAKQLALHVKQQLDAAGQQLERCTAAVQCPADAIDGLTPRPKGQAVRAHVLQGALTKQRLAALAVFEPFTISMEDQVVLTANRQQYTAGEAILIALDAQTNSCLAETKSRVSMDRVVARGDETVLEPAASHSLSSYDPSVWMFGAPEEPGEYIFRLLTSEARGRLEFGRSEQTVEVSADAAGCQGFNGTWDTNFGLLKMTVRDGQLSGSYRQRPNSRAGLITGKVSGRRVSGRWISELGEGGTRLTLSENGQTFSGTWGSQPGRVSGAGRWTGSCVVSAN